MKISCTQENLNQGLFVVSHIASKSTALPILNNVLIEAKEGSIKLLATNLEIGISCVVRGKIESEGEFTVQSKLLSDYISFLPKAQVDLEYSENDSGADQVLSVKSKNSSTKVKGQEAGDFPLIPQIETNDIHTVDALEFRQAVSQVIFSTSTSETRPEINGVLFDFNQGKLTLAATDSYRLAEKVISLGDNLKGEDKKIIIPARTLQEIQRILGSFKDPAAISEIKEIKIHISDNQVLFTFGEIELTSRLVEGQYPDYKQIIPTTSKTKAVLKSSEVINAIKTSSLFTRSGIHDVALELSAETKELIVSSTNNQLGENTSRVSIDITGESNNTVVNYRYLLDGLQNIDSDQVEISIVDSSSPCVIRPIDRDDYTYIVMPIKQ